MNIYAKVEGVAFQFERPEIDSRGFYIGSWAKFCPICLRGWAHFTAVIDGKLDGSHCVRGQLCADCGRQSTARPVCVPGSLLEEPQMNCQTLDWDLLNYLPHPMLLREFYLHDQFLNRQESKPDEHTTIANKHRAALNASWAETTKPIIAAAFLGTDTSHERKE